MKNNFYLLVSSSSMKGSSLSRKLTNLKYKKKVRMIAMSSLNSKYQPRPRRKRLTICRWEWTNPRKLPKNTYHLYKNFWNTRNKKEMWISVQSRKERLNFIIVFLKRGFSVRNNPNSYKNYWRNWKSQICHPPSISLSKLGASKLIWSNKLLNSQPITLKHLSNSNSWVYPW